MDGVTEVRPNIGTDPEFGEAMDEAKMAGIEVWFLTCHVEPDKLEITGRV
jgi:sugar fermentation stimulation protein A